MLIYFFSECNIFVIFTVKVRSTKRSTFTYLLHSEGQRESVLDDAHKGIVTIHMGGLAITLR